MLDFLVEPKLVPFTIMLCIVLFVLCIEIIGSLFGASSILDDADLDVEFDADLDWDAAFESPDIEVLTGESFWSFLEFGKVPLLVWIVCMAGGYSMFGFFMQLMLDNIFGFMLPAFVAALIAVPFGAYIGGMFATIFTLVVPKSSTQSINRRMLGGSVGKITVGTASKGNPAPAVVTDYKGNKHTVRVIPYEGDDVLVQGTEIVIMKGDDTSIFNAMSLTNAKQKYNARKDKA